MSVADALITEVKANVKSWPYRLAAVWRDRGKQAPAADAFERVDWSVLDTPGSHVQSCEFSHRCKK